MVHLFVYGTLRRGSGNRFATLLSNSGQFVDTARVPGVLYHLKEYPGAVASDQPDKWIHGEVYRVDDQNLLASLDEYEGSEFQRATVVAELEKGGAIDCWIYWYVGEASGSLISSGDWFHR